MCVFLTKIVTVSKPNFQEINFTTPPPPPKKKTQPPPIIGLKQITSYSNLFWVCIRVICIWRRFLFPFLTFTSLCTRFPPKTQLSSWKFASIQVHCSKNYWKIITKPFKTRTDSLDKILDLITNQGGSLLVIIFGKSCLAYYFNLVNKRH